MKANKVKRKLKRGDVALGTMVFEFDAPGLPRLIELAGPAIKNGSPVKEEIRLKNINRTVGTMLSAAMTPTTPRACAARGWCSTCPR